MNDGNSIELLECTKLLAKFQKRKDAVIFLEPVDYDLLQIPDYPLIIKTPMDFGTIEKKLKLLKYGSMDDFSCDMRLVFSNCMTFNDKSTSYYTLAKRLNSIFDRELLKMVKRLNEDPSEKQVTSDERSKISSWLHDLNSSSLGKILSYMTVNCPDHIVNKPDSSIELKIDDMEVTVFRKLEEMVKNLRKLTVVPNGKRKRNGAY